MRFMKKVVAFTMAVMLLIPSVAVNAEEPQVLGGVWGKAPTYSPPMQDKGGKNDEYFFGII